MEEILCHLCKKKFLRKRSQVLLAKKHYCSIECQNVDKRRGQIIICFICGKKVYKKNRDLINSKNRQYFCGVKCSNYWLGNKNRGANHPNWVNGKSVYKNLLERTKASKVCKFCGEKDSRVLIVHHIDRSRDNNLQTNLVWLCNNCHFLVHHYKVELDRFKNILINNGNP